MDEYIVFEDEQITMRIPTQLSKRSGTYIFSGTLIRGRKDTRVELGLVIDPPPVVREEAERAILSAPRHYDWEGVKMRTLRIGACPFGDGGVEVIGSTTISEQSITLFRWVLVYTVGEHCVYIDLSGGGELEAFEKMGTTIFESLVIK